MLLCFPRREWQLQQTMLSLLVASPGLDLAMVSNPLDLDLDYLAIWPMMRPLIPHSVPSHPSHPYPASPKRRSPPPLPWSTTPIPWLAGLVCGWMGTGGTGVGMGGERVGCGERGAGNGWVTGAYVRILFSNCKDEFWGSRCSRRDVEQGH